MDEPFDSSSDSIGHSLASLLLGFGVGALIGAAAAILLAPQSGVETRQDLTELTSKVKERADEMISELKQNLDELSAKSRELVDSTRERVEAAIQAGKEAAQEKKSELQAQVNPEETA
jgi:gas vesicle protein